MRIVKGKAYPTVTQTDIFGFFEEFRCFSNFHLCPVTIDGLTYPSSEHAYMAMKTLDAFQRKKLAFEIEKPGDAKKYGQTVTLREGWANGLRDTEMDRVVYAKFSQNRDIQGVLLCSAPKILHETNWWGDKYWGVCDGVGEDKLGQSLMRARDRLWRDCCPNLVAVASSIENAHADGYVPPTISQGLFKEESFASVDYSLTSRNHEYSGSDGAVRALGRCVNNGVPLGSGRDINVYIDPIDTDRMPSKEQTFIMEIEVHPSWTPYFLEKEMRGFMATLAQQRRS